MSWHRIRTSSLLSLRTSVLVGLVVGWNVGMCLAIYVNGGLSGLSSDGARIVGVTAILGSSFFLGVYLFEPLQNVVVAPARRHDLSSSRLREDGGLHAGLRCPVVAVVALRPENARVFRWAPGFAGAGMSA